MSRVALVVPSADGGIAAHARSLLHRLPALGWQVRVCAPPRVLAQLLTARSADPAPVRPHGCGVPAGVELVAVRLPASAVAAALDPRSLADLRAALAGVEVVDAQGLRAAAAVLTAQLSPRRPGSGGSRAGRRFGPVVVTLHNPPPTGGVAGLAGSLIQRRVARGADLVLGASADLVAGARAAGARRSELLEVAAPAPGQRPADPALPGSAERVALLRRQLDPAGRGLLLIAGRLAPQKDQNLALAALALLPAERRPVLAIAGAGPLAGRLRDTVAAGGLAVRLLGERTDVADLLAAADAAVLTSRWEARSLFAQEALRAGVPLVATAVGGLPGLLGDAAVLVPGRDPADLAAALDRVLRDDVLRARLAVAGPARAASWPTEDDTASAVAAALGRVLLLAWDSVER